LSFYVYIYYCIYGCFGAGEDLLHVVALTASKAANNPQFFPYPLKEGWRAMGMAKSQIATAHLIHNSVNQRLQYQHSYNKKQHLLILK